MTAEHEEWAPIPGTGGSYLASTLGRIYSVPRDVPHSRSGTIAVPGRILAPQRTKSGHRVVSVRMGGIARPRLVHHLILNTFVGPRLDGTEACHGNGVPSDNRLSNLRWGTRSDNVRDSIRHGTQAQVSKVACPFGHPLRSPNLVASKVVIGQRKCQACALARLTARHSRERHNQPWTELEIRAEADRRYADLISGRIADVLAGLRGAK